MGKMNGAGRNAVRWLKMRSFEIVIILSILHIGLAYIHARDSGGTNLVFFTRLAA